MSGTRSVLLVTNPLSGQGRGLAAAAVARERFTGRGVEVTEVRGATAAESVRLVREAVSGTAPDAVVCAGGDGLVCLALQAIGGTGVPLGLVPGGTGNDLARELGIPDGDAEAAVDIVLAGTVRALDLGEIESGTAGTEYGGRLRFATVTGTGFDARVTLRANRMRRPKGPLRYTVAALAELLGGLAVPYRIELSGAAGESGTVVETEAVMVAVGNTRTYGGGMLVCPDAAIDDGLLDLTVVGAMTRLDMVRMLPALSAGKRIDHPAVTRYRAAEITLTAPHAPVTADGDPAGMLPAVFRALPAVQPVLVP
ncbi:YegS/Rv2252/BmrU family lipid kinase [Nocardia sp. BMG51109]|uniref:YegS/Rv2252/BmrU family lipid kinase n=1 Tax=Nocardia sp. BMG51109 TaxID=1056816 RepID=UPI0004669B27|nr:YegS/Rv2252/BmrU family lipid kinase [Nocardia sp. BMG51109]